MKIKGKFYKDVFGEDYFEFPECYINLYSGSKKVYVNLSDGIIIENANGELRETHQGEIEIQFN